jgi:translation initiation factor 2 alpha subunit (eIF-2alpha)
MSSDVDPSVILSIVRRTNDSEKKMKVTKLIKEKKIDELFNLVGYKPKNHTKEMNEVFFNTLYTYLGVEDIEYANMRET